MWRNVRTECLAKPTRKLEKLEKKLQSLHDVACSRKLEVLVRATRLAVAAAAAAAAARLSLQLSYRYSFLLCPIIEHPAIRMRIVLKSEYFIGFTVQHYTLARRLDGML